MDLQTIMLVASSIIAIITGVVEAIKRSFRISGQYVPIISVLVGIAVGIALQPISEFNLYTMIVGGAIAGLSSCGLFDVLDKALSTTQIKK